MVVLEPFATHGAKEIFRKMKKFPVHFFKFFKIIVGLVRRTWARLYYSTTHACVHMRYNNMKVGFLQSKTY